MTPRAVAVAGLCAGIDPALEAGDVVCATELRRRRRHDRRGCRTAQCSSTLSGDGASAFTSGTLASTDRILGPAERGRRFDGALAVDMESAWLAAGADGRPFAVVRVVADKAGRRLTDPRMAIAGPRALRSLRRVGGALAEWAATVAPRDNLAQPLPGEAVA